MKRLSGNVLFVLCIGIVVAGIVLPACAADVSVAGLPQVPAGNLDPAAVSPVPDTVNGKVRVQLSALPLTFIPNRGQYDPAAAYVVTGPESTLFFTQDEIVITAEEKNGNESVSPVVRQTFPGASPHPLITGADQLAGTANFFTGNDPAKWQTGVPTYGAVEYHDLYPGIDLRYKGTEGTLKREFVVAPGADASAIRLRYYGVDTITVDETGAMHITAGNSTLTESPLICFQEINGTDVPVNAAYRILSDHEVTFTLGQYDPAFPLVIDPRLVYSTYLGGAGNDAGYGIAVDGSGNAYVTGYTFSSDFPTTAGAYNRTFGGDTEAFVTKLNAAGSGLVYSTYLGGAGYDAGYGIAVDGSGNAYVIGYTGSSDFPTTPGAYNRTFGGSYDAFMTKLNAAGSGLDYSTYLGGAGYDDGYGIAVDGSGNAYVTGYTESSDFPTTTGAYNRTYGGNTDAFVTKLNAAGSGLDYSTYLGGSDLDYGNGITADGNGNAYVTGPTKSSDFPTTTGAYDQAVGGICDAFVTKLNATGSGLVYSTYLGGAGDDDGYGIAVDGSGNAYVTGPTESSDFPTTTGAYNRTFGGNTDAFVTKLNAAGSGLDYSTYLGGAGDDDGYGIAVDGSGNAYVTGYTASSDFPTTAGAYNRTFGGDFDAFVTKLNAAGSGLVYSTYLGGAGYDAGYGIAVDGSGNAYVTGYTASVGFPITGSAYDISNNGLYDAFVARLSLVPSASGVGVFRPSIQKFILKNGTERTVVQWGLDTDIPVAGDWNGDGLGDVGVFRPSIQKFILKNGTDRTVVQWGLDSDTPVAGDWNGDGMGDVGVYRPSIQKFILKNGTERTVVQWGLDSDTPVAGDWNGDGMGDVGVFRPSIQKFILKNGTERTVVPWGLDTDTPVAGDWNGDGLGDVGVYRPSIQKFILKNGTERTVVQWGLDTDIPVAGKWR